MMTTACRVGEWVAVRPPFQTCKGSAGRAGARVRQCGTDACCALEVRSALPRSRPSCSAGNGEVPCVVCRAECRVPSAVCRRRGGPARGRSAPRCSPGRARGGAVCGQLRGLSADDFRERWPGRRSDRPSLSGRPPWQRRCWRASRGRRLADVSIRDHETAAGAALADVPARDHETAAAGARCRGSRLDALPAACRSSGVPGPCPTSNSRGPRSWPQGRGAGDRSHPGGALFL